MHYQELSPGIILLRLEKGEEVISTLQHFVISQSLKGGVCTGIGAVRDLELAYFDIETKKYLTKQFADSYEVTALSGTLSWKEADVVAHLHGTFADQEMRPIAGHINKAVVSGTLELWIHTSASSLTRFEDMESGLTLLNLEHQSE